MQKTLFPWIVMTTLLLVAPFSTPALAGNGFYLGFGGSYAYSEIDADDISVLDEADVKINFGDTYGFNARLGWRIINLLALEFNFDYLPGFESDEVIKVFDLPTGVGVDMDVMTLMLDAKLIPLSLGPLELSLFGGLGAMKAEVSGSSGIKILDDSVDLSEDDTLLCGELGLGLGLSLSDAATLSVEGSYVAGLGEFGGYDYGIGYVLVTAAVDFYF